MGKKYEDIFQETYDNIKQDRQNIDNIITSIISENKDPVKTISGKVAYLTEIKIKANEQMLELLKIKKDEPKASSILDDADVEKVWNEIDNQLT